MHNPGVIMRNEVCALPQGEDLNENGSDSRGNFPLSAVPSFAKPASLRDAFYGAVCGFRQWSIHSGGKQQDERSETLIIHDKRRVGEKNNPTPEKDQVKETRR